MRRLVLLAAALLATGLLAWVLASRDEAEPQRSSATETDEPAAESPGLRGASGPLRKAEASEAEKAATNEPPAGADTKEGPRTVQLRVWGAKGRVAGAEVQLVFADGERRRVATTDAQGVAMFGFGTWPYILFHVEKRGYVPRTLEYDADEVARDAAGNHLKIELFNGVEARGTVVDGVTGRPVVGAEVQVNDWENDLALGPTDAEGHFAHPGLMNDSEAYLSAVAPGYATTRLSILVDSGAVKPAPLVVLLLPGGRVTGRILRPDGTAGAGAAVEAISYITHDPDYTPTRSENLTHFYYSDSNLREDHEEHVTTTAGPDGTYTLEGLSTQITYRLRARAEGYAPARPVDGVRVAVGSFAQRHELTLCAPARVVVVLRAPGSEPAPQTARVRLFKDGVLHLPATPAEPRAGGRYRFLDLAPGHYQAYAETTGFLPTYEELHVREGGRHEVEVPLDAGAVVEGVVVDAKGDPVPGAEVKAAPARPNAGGTSRWLKQERKARTDAQGRFRIGGLPPGPCVLVATLWSIEIRLRTPARVKCSAPAVGVRVQLLPFSRFVARVLKPDGSPLEAEIHYFVTSATGGADNTEDVEKGRLDITGLELGDAQLVIAAPGFAWLHRQITVRAGSTTDLGEIRLTAGVTVSGRVVDKDGRPIAGARLTCDANPNRATLTDAEGRFRFERFPREAMAFTIEAENFVMLERTVPSTPGGVTIQMGRPTPVRGQVLLGGASLPADSWLELRPKGARRITMTVEGDDGPEKLSYYHGAGHFDVDETGIISEDEIAPGRYVAWLHTPRAEDRRLGEVTVVEGRTNELRVGPPPK